MKRRRRSRRRCESFERDTIDIGNRIDAALTSGDKDGLAALYLELARCYAKLGNENSRMSALRSAAAMGPDMARMHRTPRLGWNWQKLLTSRAT